MPWFTVTQQAVYEDYYHVEASTPEEAAQSVRDGWGELVHTEYSHVLADNNYKDGIKDVQLHDDL